MPAKSAIRTRRSSSRCACCARAPAACRRGQLREREAPSCAQQLVDRPFCRTKFVAIMPGSGRHVEAVLPACTPG